MRWFLKSAEDREATGAGDEPGGLVPAPIDTLIPVEFAADGPGKRTFGMYCSGCHGFNGLRLFSAAPSFAMGERMTKSDQELMHSILEGKGLMPSWKDKLSLAELEAALVYLRELALRTGFGTDPVTDLDVPETYFIFRPSGWREPEPAEQR